MDEPTLARFMAKVNKTETCWLWTGALDGRYSLLSIDGIVYKGHRLSYLHHHGKIQEGLVVRHKCLNKHCVNPNHLETGTKQENAIDMFRDKTMKLKLTEEQVLDIRSRTGQSNTQIGKEFGVSRKMISKIINRESWKHIN
jgi:DNA-directed RNA polymerase specialized sigma subunit